MNLLTKEQQESYKIQKSVVFIKKNKYVKDKNYFKVRDHCHYTGEYRGAANSICNLKYNVPKKIPIAFHNGSNHDYHFIIKESAEEFKKQSTCLGENTERYITFTVPVEKKGTRIDKNGEKLQKNISYILQFIDSARFMAARYQILSIIFLKEFIKLNVNMDTMIKNVKLCGITYKVYNCLLEHKKFKDDLLEYKCLCCNKRYQKTFDEKLKERFFNTYKYSNHNKNKFISLLLKSVYPYEYMDDWEIFNEISLPEKEDFYSHLNMKDITDDDYTHAKRVCKYFEIKNLGQYHDLHVQSMFKV